MANHMDHILPPDEGKQAQRFLDKLKLSMQVDQTWVRIITAVTAGWIGWVSRALNQATTDIAVVRSEVNYISQRLKDKGDALNRAFDPGADLVDPISSKQGMYCREPSARRDSDSFVYEKPKQLADYR